MTRSVCVGNFRLLVVDLAVETCGRRLELVAVVLGVATAALASSGGGVIWAAARCAHSRVQGDTDQRRRRLDDAR